ncbi:MAG: hypothetical protein ACJ8GW_03150 [Massilia sp.]
MAFSKVLVSLLFGSALVACGGGGGNAPAQVSDVHHPAFTAGIFDVNYGGFSGIYTMLDNNQFQGMHFVNGSVLAGHPHGLLSATNSISALERISWANFIDDSNQVGAQETNGRFGRTFSTNLQVAISGSMGSFNASAASQKLWGDGSAKTLYDDAIPLATLAGNYKGILRTAGIGKPMEDVNGLTIDASGNLSASAVGCSFSGKLVQHGVTGVYDLQVATSGSGCTLNATLKGVVTPMSMSGGVPKLGVLLDSVDNTQSAVFVITKS